MVIQILCVASILDNLVNPMEHKLIKNLLNDRSGLDDFVRLVDFNTNYMIESTKSYVGAKSVVARIYCTLP